jgi:Na+/pantothenate symporter
VFTIQLGILGANVVLLYVVTFHAGRLGRGGVVGYFPAGRGLPTIVVAVAPADITLAGPWAADVSTACALLLGSATLVVGIVVLALRQFVPEVRLVSHPIYAEWIVCLATFLLVPLFDRRRIVAPGAT